MAHQKVWKKARTMDAPAGGGFSIMSSETDGYLMKDNNLGDIPNKHIARQNLGISVSVTAPVSPDVNDIWIDLDS